MRNKRVDGKVKQEFIRYIGKKMNSTAVRRVSTHDVKVMEVRRSMDVEAVRKYYDRDSVERAFKQITGVLDPRPVRAWLKSHIDGHVEIYYLAHSILSYLGYVLEGNGISKPDSNWNRWL